MTINSDIAPISPSFERVLFIIGPVIAKAVRKVSAQVVVTFYKNYLFVLASSVLTKHIENGIGISVFMILIG